MSKRKRERSYPAFPTGDEYQPGEMVDTHTRWDVKVTVVDAAEMARRAEANKGRTLPDDPYKLEDAS